MTIARTKFEEIKKDYSEGLISKIVFGDKLNVVETEAMIEIGESIDRYIAHRIGSHTVITGILKDIQCAIEAKP